MNSTYSFVKHDVIRGMKPDRTKAIFESHGLQGVAFPDLEIAIKDRFERIPKNELIFVGGSNFIIADLLKLKENNQLPF